MIKMNFFETKKPDAYTIIVGCGRLGANLANTLSDAGRNVLILDQNNDSFRRLSSSFGGLSVVGDGTDFQTLKEAEIDKACVVVAVTNNDNTNIMVAQIARDMFHVDHVIARLYDPERECVYREFGIDTICPAVLSVKEIDKFLGDLHRNSQDLKEMRA